MKWREYATISYVGSEHPTGDESRQCYFPNQARDTSPEQLGIDQTGNGARHSVPGTLSFVTQRSVFGDESSALRTLC